MKVYELLAKSDAWTQRALARTSSGVPIYSPCDKLATAWCFYGAIMVCYTNDEQRAQAVLSVNTRLRDSEDKDDDWMRPTDQTMRVTWWNDRQERRHEEVVQMARDLDI